jgi:hypothetical protein
MLKHSLLAGLLLGMFQCTHAAGADGSSPTTITVTTKVIHDHFGGVGFHADFSLPWSTPEHFDQVLAKRWRELEPSFARVSHWWLNDQPGVRDPKMLQDLARQLVFMKQSANTEIYLTTMGLGPVRQGEARADYVRAVVDDIEYLWKQGATNIRQFCVTNELSSAEWADLTKDLPTFKDYHQLIFEELKKRQLPIRLLATDASPIVYWKTIEWAAANMDEITGVYGGHHYANGNGVDDLSFYGWFRDRCAWGVGIARAKQKDFILGEFGPAQYLQRKFGLRWDTCLYYGTPEESMAGLQLAEAAMGAINGGVYAMGYWTFTDFPDRPEWHAINQWGLFKWLTQGSEPRAPYYAYGLLTKFFRGPAIVYQVESGQENLRVAAVERQADKAWSIAVVNRNAQDTSVSIALPERATSKAFRKYVYDARKPPLTEDGDLQGPVGKLGPKDNQLIDSVGGLSLTVYTTAYDEVPPAPVQGIEVSKLPDGKLIKWSANTETDLAYYRVYHEGVRLGSTVATQFPDEGPTRSKPGKYTVVAVDLSGNTIPAK